MTEPDDGYEYPYKNKGVRQRKGSGFDRSTSYGKFSLLSEPQQSNGRWTLSVLIHRLGSQQEGATFQNADISYDNERRAIEHSLAWGCQIIDGKVAGIGPEALPT